MNTEWTLSIDDKQDVPNPSWEQVLQSLGSMDGEYRSSVWLKLSGMGALTVGGGNEGLYVVCFIPENIEWFPTLADPTRSGDMVSLVAGEETSELPAWLAVDLRLSLEAIRYFFEQGKLAQHLVWVDATNRSDRTLPQEIVISRDRPYVPMPADRYSRSDIEFMKNVFG